MSLIVSDLYKKYGDKVVVDHLSFSMKEPGVYALLGTNGAGKTTSIRMMLNMLSKDGGTVLWNNAPLNTDNCNVGYLAEERGLYPKYSLMDQLIYFAAIRGVSKDDAKKRIMDWAERLQVVEYLESKKVGKKKEKAKTADQLSKGNQQKIQFMAALLSDPELIILDEPLSGLDPVNTDMIRSILREEIEKDKYLIMSSHQMSTVEEFCTDITILHRSKAVLQGNLNEIKKSYGRVHLHLKTEEDAKPFINSFGIVINSEKAHEYELTVTGEEQANALLISLLNHKVTIITFELREPSLHELFVKTVGDEALGVVHEEK